MIQLEPPLRVAAETDASALAELGNFAGDGLSLHIWQGIAEGGQDPWEVGRARQLQKVREGQIVVVDFGDGAVASLTSHPIGTEPEPIDDDCPALFRPLLELENQALESWYVNILACYPEFRGRGLGSRLLNVAEQMARDEGLRRMSLIVGDNNAGARRLYERHGYAEAASRPSVKEGWTSETARWVLLIKPLPFGG